MGLLFFDQYSYLHFACGIIAYYWNLSFNNWLVLHTLFELLENTQFGMNFINTKLTFWPGGKPRSDNLINMIGDTVFTLIGWYSAHYLDTVGNKYNLYKLHIK
jgi:hypothetical protein